MYSFDNAHGGSGFDAVAIAMIAVRLGSVFDEYFARISSATHESEITQLVRHALLRMAILLLARGNVLFTGTNPKDGTVVGLRARRELLR